MLGGQGIGTFRGTKQRLGQQEKSPHAAGGQWIGSERESGQTPEDGVSAHWFLIHCR
jgi:hypothetical protein